MISIILAWLTVNLCLHSLIITWYQYFTGSSQDGIPCPRGSYCPSGTKDIGDTGGPTPCPDGKYTAEEGARGVD